eukprot:6391147-Pyramimonas_sp.AAC.1
MVMVMVMVVMMVMMMMLMMGGGDDAGAGADADGDDDGHGAWSCGCPSASNVYVGEDGKRITLVCSTSIYVAVRCGECCCTPPRAAAPASETGATCPRHDRPGGNYATMALGLRMGWSPFRTNELSNCLTMVA